MMYFVVALDCEAKPLIAHYRLRRDRNAVGFAVYRNEQIALIVSGIGRVAAATAVGYLQALLGNQRNCAWLNVGIGGHRNYCIGDTYLAHKISLLSSNHWYPPLILNSSCPQRLGDDCRSARNGLPPRLHL